MKYFPKKLTLARSAKVAVAMVLLIGSAAPGLASSTTYGSMSNVNVTRVGKLFFSQSGTRTTPPTCATLDRFVIDVNAPSGQAEAAVLLTALAQNKRVSVTGTGACADWGDTESVEVISIEN